ncbi:hypothetical protein QTP88_020072 [Uroleucon formosanum]
MIGQGYDGAAAMSGQFKGVQTRIREIYPLAYYIHCSAHCLNLVISDSCNIPEIRNTIGTMQSICNFFGYPKRLEVLQRCIKDLFPSSKASRLKQMCPTRWVQRHDAVILYEEMQLAVVSALEILSNNSSTGSIEEYSWISSNISSQADQLLCAIKKLQFQVSLYVLTKVLSISVGLSRSLQLENSDLKTALDAASCVENLIEQLRINSENEFMKLFETVKKTCEQIGISDFSLPRKINRQKTRNNVPAENVEQHFLRSIFIPFLDTFLLQLRERLTSHNTILKNFSCLIPKTKNPSKEQEKSFIDLHETYSSFINKSKLMTAEEFKLWYIFVEQNEMNPKSPIDALITCDKILFPTIYLLLKILVTLPITTSSAERSFSTLRRLKTYLRNTISNETKKRWRNLRDQFKKELKKAKKPKSGSSQDGLEKCHGKWLYFVSMKFLKDVETPRHTSGTFSNDCDEDTELGHSDEQKSDSNEDQENEDNLDKETTYSLEVLDPLLPQTEVQTNLTKSGRNSPISELNNSTIKSSGQIVMYSCIY